MNILLRGMGKIIKSPAGYCSGKLSSNIRGGFGL
jgi:hypothetical protein